MKRTFHSPHLAALALLAAKLDAEMSIPNPSFQGNYGASWSNTPYLDDASNVAILGPRPANIAAYNATYGPGTPAAPATATVASILDPSTPLAAPHKTALLVAIAVAAFIVVPKLLKKK